MGQLLRTAVILGFVFGAVGTPNKRIATPNKRFAERRMGEFSVYPEGVEELSHFFQMSPRPEIGSIMQSNEEKIKQQYDKIAQEVEQAERNNEEFTFTVKESDLHSDDIDRRIKSLLLYRLQQMHSQLVNGTDVEDNFGEDNAELLRLVNGFLKQKIKKMPRSPRYVEALFNQYDEDATYSKYTAQVMALNPNDYIPIYRFDRESGGYCYPDYPSSQNNGKCKGLNREAPVFYREETCGGETVYTYWLWYGWQKPCFKNLGSHGNDWEHVSVYVNPSTRQVSRVVFYQHTGYYTRRRGEFERRGERPVVYIGKIAHGSYHSGCDGKCSFIEFFRYGCLGTVKYCQGGCGYWDDFRNPGPELDALQLRPLMAGQIIDGMGRPTSSSVCGGSSCKGSRYRLLTESGCWQNKP